MRLCYNGAMDNLEYLKQISQSNRPVKQAKAGGMSTGLIVKIAVLGGVLFFLLMAVGLLLGNLGGKTSTLTKQLYARTTAVNTTISPYTATVKSSRLRAIGTSLAAVLTNSSKQLSTYLTGKDSKKDALVLGGKEAEQETKLIESLSTSLNNAKLNGLLDRTYENQITLQVSLLLSLTSQILSRSKDEQLLEIVSSLHASLNTIHGSLESYQDLSA